MLLTRNLSERSGIKKILRERETQWQSQTTYPQFNSDSARFSSDGFNLISISIRPSVKPSSTVTQPRSILWHAGYQFI